MGMIVCVHYSVCRGNSLENNEWIQEELRGLPTRLRPLAQDYDPRPLRRLAAHAQP